MNPFTKLFNSLKYRFNLDDDKAAETEVVENIKKGVEFKGTNLWTLIFAIFIASIGLNVNSTAVIIGAMLISPLMGPIMGIGLGAAIFEFKLIKKALKNLLIAVTIGLITSTAYFLISPINQAQSELLARTSPTIWDVLIAFFGGLAGIVASSRRKYNNVIPGVAIATALMPPLCTGGFGLATGQWSYFFGAFYLFVINSVFISIATFLIVRFLKFKPVIFVDANTSLKVKKWITFIAVLTIIPSVYLAYRFVSNEIFTQNANKLINEDVIQDNFTVIKKKILPEKREIQITLFGDRNTDSVKNLLDLRKLNHNLGDATLIIKANRNGTIEGKKETIDQLKDGVIEDLFTSMDEKLKQKNNEIKNLLKLKSKNEQFNAKKVEAIKEFYALYGKPKELIIERVIEYGENTNDTVLLVYINTKAQGIRKDIEQIRSWLETKFNLTKTKILFN